MIRQLTASEARTKAKNIHQNKINEQLLKVDGIINEAVGKGELYANFYGWPLPDVKFQLESRGFIVKSSSHNNEDETKISW